MTIQPVPPSDTRTRLRLRNRRALLLACWLALPSALPAADGDLDPTFWGDGRMFLSSVYDGNFRVGAVLAAPDG